MEMSGAVETPISPERNRTPGMDTNACRGSSMVRRRRAVPCTTPPEARESEQPRLESAWAHASATGVAARAMNAMAGQTRQGIGALPDWCADDNGICCLPGRARDVPPGAPGVIMWRLGNG